MPPVTRWRLVLDDSGALGPAGEGGTEVDLPFEALACDWRHHRVDYGNSYWGTHGGMVHISPLRLDFFGRHAQMDFRSSSEHSVVPLLIQAAHQIARLHENPAAEVPVVIAAAVAADAARREQPFACRRRGMLPTWPERLQEEGEAVPLPNAGGAQPPPKPLPALRRAQMPLFEPSHDPSARELLDAELRRVDTAHLPDADRLWEFPELWQTLAVQALFAPEAAPPEAPASSNRSPQSGLADRFLVMPRQETLFPDRETTITAGSPPGDSGLERMHSARHGSIHRTPRDQRDEDPVLERRKAEKEKEWPLLGVSQRWAQAFAAAWRVRYCHRVVVRQHRGQWETTFPASTAFWEGSVLPLAKGNTERRGPPDLWISSNHATGLVGCSGAEWERAVAEWEDGMCCTAKDLALLLAQRRKEGALATAQRAAEATAPLPEHSAAIPDAQRRRPRTLQNEKLQVEGRCGGALIKVSIADPSRKGLALVASMATPPLKQLLPRCGAATAWAFEPEEVVLPDTPTVRRRQGAAGASPTGGGQPSAAPVLRPDAIRRVLLPRRSSSHSTADTVDANPLESAADHSVAGPKQQRPQRRNLFLPNAAGSQCDAASRGSPRRVEPQEQACRPRPTSPPPVAAERPPVAAEGPPVVTEGLPSTLVVKAPAPYLVSGRYERNAAAARWQGPGGCTIELAADGRWELRGPPLEAHSACPSGSAARLRSLAPSYGLPPHQVAWAARGVRNGRPEPSDPWRPVGDEFAVAAPMFNRSGQQATATLTAAKVYAVKMPMPQATPPAEAGFSPAPATEPPRRQVSIAAHDGSGYRGAGYSPRQQRPRGSPSPGQSPGGYQRSSSPHPLGNRPIPPPKLAAPPPAHTPPSTLPASPERAAPAGPQQPHLVSPIHLAYPDGVTRRRELPREAIGGSPSRGDAPRAGRAAPPMVALPVLRSPSPGSSDGQSPPPAPCRLSAQVHPSSQTSPPRPISRLSSVTTVRLSDLGGQHALRLRIKTDRFDAAEFRSAVAADCAVHGGAVGWEAVSVDSEAPDYIVSFCCRQQSTAQAAASALRRALDSPTSRLVTRFGAELADPRRRSLAHSHSSLRSLHALSKMSGSSCSRECAPARRTSAVC
eukprot:TRINITY_DN4539_c0_g1_i1.p1 TRINITY_DN4539_c0_g1~~TRINITY_DN4539_c0_g1_i1.p1  ORF type:complete len:1118 (+),score=134.98 TRINITY_DN4539_c0_g1_i1:2039-5392(+)